MREQIVTGDLLDWGFLTKIHLYTACPEVEIHAVTAEHEFVLLACDGIWDVMTNQEAINFCRERLVIGLLPDKVQFHPFHLFNFIFAFRPSDLRGTSGQVPCT